MNVLICDDEPLFLEQVRDHVQAYMDGRGIHAHLDTATDPRRLYAGLDKAMEYIDGAYVDVFVYNQQAQVRLLVDDILYVTRENRRVVVTQARRYVTGERLDVWEEKLPNLFFYPVHKSFLVNLHHVTKYAYSELYLSTGERIPIAPGGRRPFTNTGLNI